MKISFFGDSFCSEKDVPMFKRNYNTYINLLETHYNTNIIKLGIDGSSIWDLILLQFDPSNITDVCIFVWTNPGRLFHRKIRNIYSGSINVNRYSNKPVWDAAKSYYQHLYDYGKDDFDHISSMFYFDQTVLAKLPSDIKIIHLWAFASVDWHHTDRFHPKNIKYPYRWSTGVEIRPPLITVSMLNEDDSKLSNDPRPNHLDGYKNEIVFNWIKHAIDNYQSGSCLSFDEDVSKLITVEK